MNDFASLSEGLSIGPSACPSVRPTVTRFSAVALVGDKVLEWGDYPSVCLYVCMVPRQAGRPTDLAARPSDLAERPSDLAGRPSDLDGRLLIG